MSSQVATPIALLCLLAVPNWATAQWMNGLRAERVVGQPDFISSGSSLTQSGLASPLSAVDEVNRKLYVGDGSRVLRYALPITRRSDPAQPVPPLSTQRSLARVWSLIARSLILIPCAFGWELRSWRLFRPARHWVTFPV
jgi:hypothetical protein